MVPLKESVRREINPNIENSKGNKTTINESKNKTETFEKTKSIRAKTIANMLLRQNVESNPGPENNIKPNVVIRTFNCNGLGNINKLRRLLIKLKPE